MFARHRRTIAVTLSAWLLLQTAGCDKWVPVTNPLPDQPQNRSTANYRITTRTSDVVILSGVHYRSDSIFGTPPETTASREVGFPVSDIVGIEKQTANTEGTLRLMIAALQVPAAVTWVIFMTRLITY